MVNNVQKFIEKATAAPDAALDAADVTTATTEGREIVEKAKELAQAERDELRREIEKAARETAGTPEDKQALEALAGEIESIDAPKVVEAPEEGVVPDALRNMLPEPLQKLLGMGESGARGAMKGIGGAFGAVKSSTIFGIASVFDFFDSPFMKGIANWLRGFAEPGAIREAMGKTLKVKVTETPEDKGYTETLRAQYEAKLDADKKDPKVYSFQTFYTQKITELAKAGPKETYTLEDLVSIPSAEQRAAEEQKAAELAEKAAKREEETAKKEAEKKVKENPTLAYVETFRDALNTVSPNAIAVTPGESLNDIARKVATAFSEENDAGLRNFGLETNSGGDLEEADGDSMFTVDYNLLDLWEDKLLNNPVGAINAFLALDPAKWESTNAIAAQTIQKVREYMAAKGIKPPTIGTPAPDAPTESPAAAE